MNVTTLQREWALVKPTVASLKKEKDHKDRKLLPCMTKLLLVHQHDDSIPNLKRVLSTLLTLPMSSVDCERGFSQMKLIKTRLRNSLSESALNMAMLVAIEGP